MSASGTADRLRYNEAHWACEADAQKALDQYLRLGDRVYNKTKLKLFLGLAGDVNGKRILDYGGGAGILAIPLAKRGANVVVVDAEANALKTAELYARREGVSSKIETVQSLAFPASLTGQRFDIIVAKDVVEHMDEDEPFLLAVSRCQDANGILLLSTQNRQSLNYLIEGSYQKYWLGNRDWRGWDLTHVRFYTSRSLRQRLERAGYQVNRWAGVFLIPYNILSWLTLLRLDVELPVLHHVDEWLGRVFPFNRWGWNIIVRATRKKTA